MSILIQGERQSYPLSVTTPHTVWNVEKCPHCKSIVYAEQTKKKTLLNLSSTVMSLCLPWQTLSHWNKEKAVSAVFLIGIRKN